MPLTTLPNGLALETPSSKGARFLYREIFEQNSYTKHGSGLEDGATVFDVGANVGAFSIALAQWHRDLRLVLFEPIPHTFALLERNADRLLGSAHMTLVRAGVWSAPGREAFRVPPSWSLVAGLDASRRKPQASRKVAVETLVRAWIEDAQTGPSRSPAQSNVSVSGPQLATR